MTTLFTTQRIGILAPDAATALALEKRLSHLEPTTVGRHDGWMVELEDDGYRFDEVIAAVRHWLRENGLESTSVHTDGATYEVCATPPECSELAVRQEPRVRGGDLIEICRHGVGESGQAAEVLSVLGEPGHEHYFVRWEDGRESIFPGSDATIRPLSRDQAKPRTVEITKV